MKDKHSYLKYAALGDSLTVGVGASLFAPGFVFYYARFIERNLCLPVRINVYAKSGIETGDVLEIVKTKALHEKINEANIITLSAGANDLINASRTFESTGNNEELMRSLKECRENIDHIMDVIKELKSNCGQPYMIRLLNLYNPFPDIQFADKWIQLFNRALNGFDDGHLIRVADIYSAFKGKEAELLSVDKVHPNDRGYQLIAKCLNDLGYEGIT
ncbi:GDSL-type esterase/lipase family protein [Metabacillus fastidiosus]|uniref:GDSL-type esterase/lipase family protein n=1 Tax=Metabacillus fastidiosus TaxID=1458 RepID=UPI002E1B7DD4|nr:GDSL-type esterase/lipase family protein [Metabacillus fastidiosus]